MRWRDPRLEWYDLRGATDLNTLNRCRVDISGYVVDLKTQYMRLWFINAFRYFIWKKQLPFLLYLLEDYQSTYVCRSKWPILTIFLIQKYIYKLEIWELESGEIIHLLLSLGIYLLSTTNTSCHREDQSRIWSPTLSFTNAKIIGGSKVDSITSTVVQRIGQPLPDDIARALEANVYNG